MLAFVQLALPLRLVRLRVRLRGPLDRLVQEAGAVAVVAVQAVAEGAVLVGPVDHADVAAHPAYLLVRRGLPGVQGEGVERLLAGELVRLPERLDDPHAADVGAEVEHVLGLLLPQAFERPESPLGVLAAGHGGLQVAVLAEDAPERADGPDAEAVAGVADGAALLVPVVRVVERERPGGVAVAALDVVQPPRDLRLRGVGTRPERGRAHLRRRQRLRDAVRAARRVRGRLRPPRFAGPEAPGGRATANGPTASASSGDPSAGSARTPPRRRGSPSLRASRAC